MVRMQRTLFGVLVVVALVVIGGVWFLGRSKAPAGTASGGIQNPDPLLQARIVYGAPDAPVTVVDFSNYRCPHCRNHALNALPKIFARYVDSGKVRYVFRALPFSGQTDVFDMSVASACVYEQDPERFVAYHELLFRAVDDWAGKTGEALIGRALDYARQLSLDTGRLKACIEEGKTREEVAFDQKLAASLGVDGTPTFFINGKKYVGFMPFEKWQTILGP